MWAVKITPCDKRQGNRIDNSVNRMNEMGEMNGSMSNAHSYNFVSDQSSNSCSLCDLTLRNWEPQDSVFNVTEMHDRQALHFSRGSYRIDISALARNSE